MKAITVHVSEPVYREFQEIARREDRKAAELIRESMDQFLKNRAPKGRSILDFKPASVGKVKRPFNRRGDLLAEMLSDLRT